MSKQRNTPIQICFRQTARRRIWVFLVFFVSLPALGLSNSPRFAEQVNLALRRTAHQLLIGNGDTLSGIPPVEQSDSTVFLIRVDSLFDYDKLPPLLQESLTIYGINQAYEVAIVNCNDGQIQLGYSYLDLSGKTGVPCRGRQQQAGCYLLKVSFLPSQTEHTTGEKWWFVFTGCLLAGLGLIVWRKSATVAAPREENYLMDKSSQSLKFGKTALDVSQLLLYTGDQVHNLTYREAKLLNLFATHQNEILDRDFILASVWEDEGVTVGRSIDVFVSRLRKLLRPDTSIKIAAVHGIGYRMEITG